MMIDLLDWEVGCACSLCASSEADLRDRDYGPVCSDCMVDLLRAERFLRDSVGQTAGREMA